MLAWPPATGAVPSAAPSTENVTVPVAGTPVEVLSTASTVDPAGSGVTVSARVAVAATGAAGADDDDGALGAEAADAAARTGPGCSPTAGCRTAARRSAGHQGQRQRSSER